MERLLRIQKTKIKDTNTEYKNRLDPWKWGDLCTYGGNRHRPVTKQALNSHSHTRTHLMSDRAAEASRNRSAIFAGGIRV